LIAFLEYHACGAPAEAGDIDDTTSDLWSGCWWLPMALIVVGLLSARKQSVGVRSDYLRYRESEWL